MHLVSLESLGFRNINVNRYTTDYCYRQLLFKVHHTHTDRYTNIWVREKAMTLFC